jgi:hypothetical protein
MGAFTNGETVVEVGNILGKKCAQVHTRTGLPRDCHVTGPPATHCLGVFALFGAMPVSSDVALTPRHIALQA